jgi:ADP-ribose pyrophosphatase
VAQLCFRYAYRKEKIEAFFLMEQWINRQKIFKGRIFNIEGGEAMLDDGRIVRREVVTHDGGVGVVPVLEENVLLIRQFRIAVDDYILEIPAGRREGREPPDRRAALELEEEIGYRAKNLQLLASYYSSAGFTNERMFIYLATGLQKVGQALEPDEQIEIVPVPMADLPRMLADGRIVDAKTIIGLRELLARPELLQEVG